MPDLRHVIESSRAEGRAMPVDTLLTLTCYGVARFDAIQSTMLARALQRVASPLHEESGRLRPGRPRHLGGYDAGAQCHGSGVWMACSCCRYRWLSHLPANWCITRFNHCCNRHLLAIDWHRVRTVGRGLGAGLLVLFASSMPGIG